MNFLQGKKSYIAAAALFILGGLTYMGYITRDQAESIGLMIGGVLGVSLRSAISNSK